MSLQEEEELSCVYLRTPEWETERGIKSEVTVCPWCCIFRVVK